MPDPGATKDAILTILGTAGINTVDRRWSPPTEGEDYGSQEPEATYFGDTEIVDDDWDALGAGASGLGTRREVYRIGVTILVVQTGDDPRSAEVRMWAIRSAIYTALRDDLFNAPSTLRTAGVEQFTQITGQQITGVWGPSQWASRFDGRITFQARST